MAGDLLLNSTLLLRAKDHNLLIHRENEAFPFHICLVKVHLKKGVTLKPGV